MSEYEMIKNFAFDTLTETLNESIRASKFPMSIDTNTVSCKITGTVQRLANFSAGTGHNNFLSGIIVQMDLTFTKQAWCEWERYHFQQIVSSQSTMHRLIKMDIDKSCIEYVDKDVIAAMKRLIQQYNENPSEENYLRCIYSAPTGILLTARVTTNYLQLKTMYQQRHDHRLPEWRELCKWMKELPYSEWITGEE